MLLLHKETLLSVSLLGEGGMEKAKKYHVNTYIYYNGSKKTHIHFCYIAISLPTNKTRHIYETGHNFT